MASKDGIPTGTSVLDKCNKLFKARSRYEVELKDVYTELNAALQAENKRRSKIESLLGKAEERFTKCINKNSELYKLARSTEDPTATQNDLDQWLKICMNRHEQHTDPARKFCDNHDTDAGADVESVMSRRSSASHSHKSSMSRTSKFSMNSSQRRRALAANTLRLKEVERQNDVAMQLEKDKHELEKHKSELDHQQKMKEMAEEKRAKINDLKINEFELNEEESEIG